MLRACGAAAPASVPALVRARLAKPSSSVAASAVASSSALEELAADRKGLARVVLKKGKTQIFRDGSPMVYSGAVDRIIGRPPPKTGDVVLVADGSEKPIGWGVYNSVSMFCVRLMQLEEEAKRDPASALNMERLLEERLCSAVDLRRSLGFPSTNTNAYRLINSEGDRLSGLIVDIFADVAVIASSAAWVEKYRQQIQSLVSKVSDVNHIKWRSSTDILNAYPLARTPQPSLPPRSLSLVGRHSTKPRAHEPYPLLPCVCVLVATFAPHPHRCPDASTSYNGSMADGRVQGTEDAMVDPSLRLVAHRSDLGTRLASAGFDATAYTVKVGRGGRLAGRSSRSKEAGSAMEGWLASRSNCSSCWLARRTASAPPPLLRPARSRGAAVPSLVAIPAAAASFSLRIQQNLS